jgi:uncharacterized membrane protein YhaH (DUF805 family)
MLEFDRNRTDSGDVLFGAEPVFSTPRFLKMWPLAAIWSSVCKVKFFGAGFDVAWHTVVLRQLAIAELQRLRDPDKSSIALKGPDYMMGGLQALLQMFFWIPDMQWIVKFSAYSGLVVVLLLLTVVSIYPYFT